MTADEKLRMARQLDRLGVDIIEAGFPVSSEGDFHSVQLIARQVRRPIIAALARCCRSDIERAWEALKAAAHPRIHTFLATSDIHLLHKLKLSRRECLEQARDAVAFAKSLCEDVEFSPEDATRSDPDFLCDVLRATIEAGATTVNIPDTVGFAVPSEFADLIREGRETFRTVSREIIDLKGDASQAIGSVTGIAQSASVMIDGVGQEIREFIQGDDVDLEATPEC